MSSVGMQSCSDWLDINTNELAATKTEAGYLFNYAAINYSSKRVGGDQWIPVLLAAQVASDCDYWFWGEDMYNISPYATGNGWVATYSSCGFNLKEAIKFAEEKGNKNAVAQCKLLLAQTIWESTVMYGDVPCSQAWDIVNNKTPEFDSQKDVLAYVVHLCDEAIASIDPSDSKCIDKYDIYYTGDMEKWMKLANSLKLRTLLYMANKENVGDKIAALVNEGNLLSSSDDDFKFPFFTTPGNQTPNYQLDQQYPEDYCYTFYANPTVLNPMQAMNDPRIPFFFRANAQGEYIALDASVQGSIMLDEAVHEDYSLCTEAVFNKRYFAADFPDVICSYAEVQFYLAEIYVKGLGVAKDYAKADAAYKEGIKASCITNGVAEADAETFVARLASLSALGGDEEALKAIADQQRIEMMVRPLEAWSNQRRTGYPVLQVPANIAGDYPDVMHRWLYPDREGSVNANVPEVEGIWTKMWFEN